MPKMRAKMRVYAIIPAGAASDGKPMETLKMACVAKSTAYPSDGSDEDNSFARWSPSGSLDIVIANPLLVGTFQIGETFYVDFTSVTKEG